MEHHIHIPARQSHERLLVHRVERMSPESLEVVDDAGHLARFDQPGRVATLIADFVGGA